MSHSNVRVLYLISCAVARASTVHRQIEPETLAASECSHLSALAFRGKILGGRNPMRHMRVRGTLWPPVMCKIVCAHCSLPGAAHGSRDSSVGSATASGSALWRLGHCADNLWHGGQRGDVCVEFPVRVGV